MANVGVLNVLLRLDSSEFQQGVRNAADRAQQLGRSIRDVGSTMSARITAPIAAAGSAALLAASNVGNFADQLLDLSDQTGISTDALQAFRAMALDAGVDTDAVASAVAGLNRRLASGEEGSGAMRNAMERLGVELRDTNGELRPMEDIVGETMRALADMENVTERNAEAQRIFGGRARELAPILAMGSEAMDDATEKFEELGLAMSEDALQAANDFRRDFDQLKATAGAVMREFGMAVMPVMKDFVALLQRDVVPRVRDLIRRFQEMSPQTQRVIAVVGALVAAIGPLLVALGTVIQVAGVVLGALAALNPVVLAVAGVVGTLTAAWLLFGDEIRAVVDVVVRFVQRMANNVRDIVRELVRRWRENFETLQSIVQTMSDVVGRIVSALMDRIRDVFSSGLGRVVDIVTNTTESVSGAFGWLADRLVGNSIVVDMVDDVVGEFQRMETGVVDITQTATTRVSDSWKTGGEEIEEEVEGLTGRLLRTFEDLGIDIPDEIESFLDRSKSLWDNWGESVLDIVESLWNRLKGLFDQMADGAQQVPGLGAQPAIGAPGGPTFGGPGFAVGGEATGSTDWRRAFADAAVSIAAQTLAAGGSADTRAILSQINLSTQTMIEFLAERLDLIRVDLDKLWNASWLMVERVVHLPGLLEDIHESIEAMRREVVSESSQGNAEISGLSGVIAGAASVIERAIFEAADYLRAAILTMGQQFGEQVSEVDSRLSGEIQSLARAIEQTQRAIRSLGQSVGQAVTISASPTRAFTGGTAVSQAAVTSTRFADPDGFLQSILDTTRAIERNQRSTGAGVGQNIIIQIMQQAGESAGDLADMVAERIRTLDQRLGAERVSTTRDAGSGRVIS